MLRILYDKDNNITFLVNGIIKAINSQNNTVIIKAQVKDKIKNINMILSENVKNEFLLQCKVNNQVKLWGNVLEKENSYIFEITGGQLYE